MRGNADKDPRRVVLRAVVDEDQLPVPGAAGLDQFRQETGQRLSFVVDRDDHCQFLVIGCCA